jgi:hypothetical protein
MNDNNMQGPATVTEAAREIKVLRNVDVLVVGGGPGGVSAAVSAARGGAKTVLLERYGHLGGMATGGLVNAIPGLSTVDGRQLIAGLVQETIDRVAKRGSAHVLDKRYWGKNDQSLVDMYMETGYSIFFLRKHPDGDPRLIHGALLEPEVLKYEFNALCSEAGVEILLHSWGTRPIMDGDRVKGVFFESKSGRQAILAKVVVDSTGDGDIFYQAGAGYDGYIGPNRRHANLALSCLIAGVDVEKHAAFRKEHADEYAALIAEMRGEPAKRRTSLLPGMFASPAYMLDGYFQDILPNHKGMLIIQPHVHADDQADVEEMTEVNLRLTKRHVDHWEFMRKNVPGFENSYIVQTAAQLGTTGGKRVAGEYMVTMDDLYSNTVFDDTIAIFPNVETGDSIVTNPLVHIPYRALIPKGLEGLLVGCRGFSSSEEANLYWNLIPHCMCLGQAAGAAAALAAKANAGVRDVDYGVLRDRLAAQNVILPER